MEFQIRGEENNLGSLSSLGSATPQNRGFNLGCFVPPSKTVDVLITLETFILGSRIAEWSSPRPREVEGRDCPDR